MKRATRIYYYGSPRELWALDNRKAIPSRKFAESTLSDVNSKKYVSKNFRDSNFAQEDQATDLNQRNINYT